MLLNCAVGKESWESLGLQENQTSQSKEISPEYSLEGLMLKLKLQYFGHLTQRTDSLEKTLMLGKSEGQRRRGQQRIASPTQWTWVWASPGSSWWTGLSCCSPWVTKSQLGLNDWTELIQNDFYYCLCPTPTDWLLVISSTQFLAPGTVYIL